MEFDEQLSRRVEATYMTPEVVEQRRVEFAVLKLKPGEDVLDIGSGPGLFAAEAAVVVGAAGSVYGVDPSEGMLAISVGRAVPVAGSAPTTFLKGDAGALPFADQSFDAAVAVQVYEYVADMRSALGEAHRVLRPGGRLLVVDTDWDSVVWRSGDPARMRRVLAAWDDHLVDPHLPRTLTGLLLDAGFAVVERSVLPILNAGYGEQTFSAGVLRLIADFVPGHRGVTEAEAQAWADDLTSLGPDYFFSINRYVFLAVR
jgi:ubiquinone/menaquinone biosynthesis C-methylase UbiE